MEILKRRSDTRVRRVVIAALLAATARLTAQPASVMEDDVKAAFLYNFAKYVAWPEESFPSGAFHVCVFADESFVKSLDAIIAGETIDGRSVTRLVPISPEAARSCHILFVGGGEAGRIDRLLAAVKGAHVLTVGDTFDFLSRGGVVTFVRDGERVRFDVSVAQAQRAGLTISSRLLRVARRVSPGAGR
ncbi:MAG: YfiR family protein [Acidobacteriota bacterium]